MTEVQLQPKTPSTTPNSHTESSQKLVWSSPIIRSLGPITTQTGEGGSANEYDSYSNHRK